MLLRSRRENKTAVFCLHFRYPAQKCLQSAVHVSKLNMKDTLWSSGHVFGGWAGSVAAAGMPTCQHAPLSQADDTLQQRQRGSRLSFWAMRSGAQQISSTWESKAVSCNMLHYVCGGSWADQFICHSYVSSGGGQRRGGRSGTHSYSNPSCTPTQHGFMQCNWRDLFETITMFQIAMAPDSATHTYMQIHIKIFTASSSSGSEKQSLHVHIAASRTF